MNYTRFTRRKIGFVLPLVALIINNEITHPYALQNWKETLLDDLKLVHPTPIIPLSIRSLVEKQLAHMKSSDPHAVLAALMSNTGKPKEERLPNAQRLRLDLWDMPGSTSSCGITHQVCVHRHESHRACSSFLLHRSFYRRELSTCSCSISPKSSISHANGTR